MACLLGGATGFASNRHARGTCKQRALLHARNREWQPFDRSIDIRIGRLRRKVEADPGTPRTIRTVRNGGYMFVPDDRPLSDA